jgi:Transglycosylase SLT domain
MTIDATSSQLAAHGVAYAPAIAQAAARHDVDPTLLAAVAAQETGGPGANAGHNEVGDGGHGHGLFQIDDRYHSFAGSASAMDPAKNADYAAGMLHGLIQQYGGDVHKALSAYNSGSPNATGTKTDWGSQTLGYADSVMQHYSQIAGTGTRQSPGAPSPIATGAGTATDPGSPNDPGSFQESAIAELQGLIASVGSLASQAMSMPSVPSLPQPAQPQPYQRAATDYTSLFGDDDDS